MESEAAETEFTPLEELRIGIWSHGIGEHVVVPLGRPATVEDLRLTKFKAEIIEGRLVVIGPTVYGSADAARADYFAAGTQVVWDVDALREEQTRSYRANDPDRPVVYRRGDIADAEPAGPGWRFEADDLFR